MTPDCLGGNLPLRYCSQSGGASSFPQGPCVNEAAPGQSRLWAAARWKRLRVGFVFSCIWIWTQESSSSDPVTLDNLCNLSRWGLAGLQPGPPNRDLSEYRAWNQQEGAAVYSRSVRFQSPTEPSPMFSSSSEDGIEQGSFWRILCFAPQFVRSTPPQQCLSFYQHFQ